MNLIRQAAHYDWMDNPNPRKLVITCCDQLEEADEIILQLMEQVEAVGYFKNSSPYSKLQQIAV